MFTLVLALALAADPAPEVLDFIDPDGDGSITDAEFAAGCKAMAALNKSKKKPDVELLEKLDPDGDGRLSDEEILQLAAEARKETDAVTKHIFNGCSGFDLDRDGVISKKELFEINRGENSLLGRVKFADADKDGAVSLTEMVVYADRIAFPDMRSQKHPSTLRPNEFKQAAQAVLRIGGSDKRINKLEAGKIKEIHAAFDEIDADGNGQIKLIELFNWMCAQ